MKNEKSLTARLDEIAGELESIGNPRLALAVDRVSDRLEKTAGGSFSKNLLDYINRDLQKFLKSNKEHEQNLLTDINDADFWKTLDNIAESASVKDPKNNDLFDKLDRCPEWRKLMDPNYSSAKEWRDDIKKLEDWVKKVF